MTAYATSADYATFSGSADVQATATATVLAGVVNTLTIGAGGGYGYVTTPNVVIAAPTTGVRATATATVANGVVSVLTLTGGGSGYGATAPAVTIDPPTGLDRLLTRASELIDDYLRCAIYDVDDDGLPTDDEMIAAFADATCAQVEYWLTSDEEDDILGPLQSLAIGNVQALSGTGFDRVSPMYLAPRAARILRAAGLATSTTVAL